MHLEPIRSEADLARIETDQLRAIHDYWDAKRDGRPMPKRSDILGEELEPWRGNIIIVRVEEPQDFFYEFFGDNILSLFGRNIQGDRLSAFSGKSADIIRDGYLATVRERTPHHQSNFGGVAGDVYQYERVLLPLSDDGEAVDSLLVLTYQMPI